MENNLTILPEYEQLVRKANEWEYSSEHSLEEIAGILGVKKNTSRFYSQINTANKKLIEHGKVLQNIKGQGYKVLAPDEYTEYSSKKIEQAKRRTAIGYKIAEYAPVDYMSEEGKKKYDSYVNRLSTFKALVEGATVELKQLANLKPRIMINKN